MKNLNDILQQVAVQKVIGKIAISITALQIDSRIVSSQNCFVAVRGNLSDGHLFIASAIEKGAIAIVCDELPEKLNEQVTYILVSDTSACLGMLAANFYDHPSKKLKLVGVTGTNGKTSFVTLSFRLFRSMGSSCGLISTVQNQIDDTVIPSTHTTPDAISLNKLLAEMVVMGCDYCFMEVSSHALEQGRVNALDFAGAVFTNITHDHLDYHKTFENYIKAKKKFFDLLSSSAFALINTDDRNGSVMIQNCSAKSSTYALKSAATFKAKIIENSLSGLQLSVDNLEVYSRLIGEFNAYNFLAVYATAILLGKEKGEVLKHLSAVSPPDGRFEQVVSLNDNIIGIVDYAHTADALKNVLQTIQKVRSGNEKVITIIGCGGDRDKAKRPVMAQVAVHYSDLCILTSDNPRSENPEEILNEMYAGVKVSDFKKVLKIADRREAIKAACVMANPSDVILLVGKGHEKYQEIKGVKYPFDDKAELQFFFNQLNK